MQFRFTLWYSTALIWFLSLLIWIMLLVYFFFYPIFFQINSVCFTFILNFFTSSLWYCSSFKIMAWLVIFSGFPIYSMLLHSLQSSPLNLHWASIYALLSQWQHSSFWLVSEFLYYYKLNLVCFCFWLKLCSITSIVSIETAHLNGLNIKSESF